MSPVALIVLYSGMVFATSAVGGAIPLFVPRSREHFLNLFVALGAGLLLGTAFLHMLPEASEALPHSFGAWFLAGFVLMLVLERFIMVHACEEHGCHYHTVGVAAFAGLAVHGVIEGLALGSSVLVSDLGPLVLVGILSHKAPAGIALTSILQLAGKKRSNIMGFILGVSLSVPVGCLLAYWLLERAQDTNRFPNVAGTLLAMSAGTFLYIAACDLLPEIHRSDTERNKRLVAFLVGLGMSVLSGYLMGGHHH